MLEGSSDGRVSAAEAVAAVGALNHAATHSLSGRAASLGIGDWVRARWPVEARRSGFVDDRVLSTGCETHTCTTFLRLR